MSLIIHRCIVCEHPDIFHRGTDCSYSQCHMGRHKPQWGEPEILPTWKQETGEPVELIAEPGSIFRGFGLMPADLCGCDACVALWGRSVA